MGSGLRLSPTWPAFLNQLFHLDGVRLIVRGEGLSIARRTGFGIFLDRSWSGRRWLYDPVSGVMLDPEQIRAIDTTWLSPKEPLTFEIKFSRSSLGISMQMDSGLEDGSAFRRIVAMFGREPVPAETLRQEGAGAWLDPWVNRRRSLGEETRQDLRRAVSAGARCEARVAADGFLVTCASRPSFLDFDGSIARLADPGADSVVLADLESAGIDWAAGEEGASFSSVGTVNRSPSRIARGRSLSPAGTPC